MNYFSYLCTLNRDNRQMNKLKDLHKGEASNASYDHVLKYTGIFGGVQGLKMLCSVGRVKLTTKILGSMGIGLISAYGSVSEFLYNASNMGIPLNATRQTSELFEEGSEEKIVHRVMVIRTWVLWAALVSVLICLLFSPLISYFFFKHDWHHWPEVMLISLVAVGNIIAEGECSILKGLRQVRKVAIIETVLALGTLLCTIPMYYLLGVRGIILGLIACAALSAMVHFSFSIRLVPYRVRPFSHTTFVEGLPLVKVGIPYVLANVARAGLQMAIPAIILINHTMSDVGHYQAGWTVIVGYAGLVFMALESDYFPRLSGEVNNVQRMNFTINQQADVCFLIITPMLILLAVLMPYVLLALYEEEFLIVTGMATISVYYTFLRCVSLPLGYSILAKGHSIAYLTLEVIFDILFGLFIWWCYNSFGLIGAGIAYAVGAFYDVVVYYLYCHIRYGYVMRHSTILLFFLQFVCLTVAVVTCFLLPTTEVMRYVVGGAAFLSSSLLSLFWLNRRSGSMRRLFVRRRK